MTYTADHYGGFVADVKYEGEAQYPPEKEYKPAPAPKYAPAPAYAPHAWGYEAFNMIQQL